MLKNYFKIAFRNLVKNRAYSFLNIAGLAVGMAGVMIITLYVRDELSYDRYHTNADRIYRVTISTEAAEMPSWIGTPAPLGPAFKQKFPEIEAFVRFDPIAFKSKSLVSFQDKSFYEEGFVLADPNLFEVFDFKLLRGDPQTALRNPTNIVISRSKGEKYFGTEDPLGKVLTYDGKTNFTVSGVMEDVPANSHFIFDMVRSYEFLNEFYGFDVMSQWGMHNFYTYVLLREHAEVAALEAKSAPFLAELKNEPATNVHLQPITDIHLRSQIARDPTHLGDITSLYLYTVIAVVIMLIACINFMNLYTANSELRAKEIGMRKVLGAYRRQLVLQFLSESFVFAILALPVAMLLAELALPQFNLITGKALNISYAKNVWLFAGLFSLTALVGLAAGSYPAMFMSAFQPVKMLRRKLAAGSSGRKGLAFRNVLVIFQFVASIVLIAGALIINAQMQFIRNKKLGYDRENIINVSIHSTETRERYETFRNEILRNTKIVDASATSFTPSVERWREGLYFEGRKDSDEHSFFRISGDFNFVELFGLELVAGRTFDRTIPSDLNNAYLVNESAVRAIGWTPEGALGKVFGNRGKVIGVVKDFNFRSLRHDVHPLAINVMPRMFQQISIRIRPDGIPSTISFLESAWSKVNPGFPFEYYFCDTEFDKLYKSDERLQTVFSYFSFLAIFIACLGLFGLSLFTAQRRTKEIGIRKVLGASVAGIIGLLLQGLLKLVLIASLFAWPVAYFAMQSWLRDFAYRIDIGWWVFVLAGGLTLFIALLTVSAHALKAALANPVEALRYE
jgi:putative ABC transport system permease protein